MSNPYTHLVDNAKRRIRYPINLFTQCVFILSGAFSVLYLSIRSTLSEPDFEFTTGVILILLTALATTTAAITVIFLIMQTFRPRKLVALKLAFSLMIVGIVILGDNFYYSMFGKHVTLDDLSLALLAIKFGEIHLSAGDLTEFIIVAVLVLLVLFIYAYALTLLPRFSINRIRMFRAIAFIVATTILVLVFRNFAIDETDVNTAKLKASLPWELETIHTSPEYSGLFFESSGYSMSSKVEKQQYKTLERHIDMALKHPITASRMPNIVMIHVEGLRSDMINAKRMPHLYSMIGDQWINLQNHFSTGLNTGLGIFGAVSGLNGFYYPYFRRGSTPPFPLAVLKKLGYHCSVYFTKNLDYDNLYPLIFKPVVDDTISTDQSAPYVDQELDMVDQYQQKINRSRDNNAPPRFDYILMYTTHYTYFYPPEFEINRPVLEGKFKIRSGSREDFQAQAQKIKNRYLNAVLFADHQINRIVNALKESGIWDDTILIVFGDHGEEFWEKGSFGHTYKFVNEQAKTTAVLRFPSKITTPQYKYSSHCDFMPTLFDYMNVTLDDSTYMTGKSLMRYTEDLDYSIVGKGVIKSQTNSKFLIASSGYKIKFRNKGELLPEWIVDDLDNPIDNPDNRLVEKILLRAKFAKSLPDKLGDSPPDRYNRNSDPRHRVYAMSKQQLIDEVRETRHRKINRAGANNQANEGRGSTITLIPEQGFSIASSERRISYDFTIPQDNSIDTWDVLVKISGARDDTGDRGLYCMLFSEKNTEVEKKFLKARGLSVFVIECRSGTKWHLIVEDLDTELDGDSPGNNGSLEVLALPHG